MRKCKVFGNDLLELVERAAKTILVSLPLKPRLKSLLLRALHAYIRLIFDSEAKIVTTSHKEKSIRCARDQTKRLSHSAVQFAASVPLVRNMDVKTASLWIIVPEIFNATCLDFCFRLIMLSLLVLWWRFYYHF